MNWSMREKCPGWRAWAAVDEATSQSTVAFASVHSIALTPDLCKLRSTDYAEYWRRRRDYLLAQAQWYTARHGQEVRDE